MAGEAIEVGGQSGNYNEEMLLIRYTALLALVVWLGGMILLALVVGPSTFQVLQSAAPANGSTIAGPLFGTCSGSFMSSHTCAAR